jgi:hypothetical protein
MTKLNFAVPGLAAFACLLTSACFSGSSAAYPLYPHTDQPLPREQVATLSGAVEAVDGQRVAQWGHTFALMPGCHEVTNLQHWGGADSSSAATATLPALRYSIWMRAGFSYVVHLTPGAGTVSLSATEQDEHGQVTQSFEPGVPCAEPAQQAENN